MPKKIIIKKKSVVVENEPTTDEDELFIEEPNDELDLNVLSQLMDDSDDEEKPKKKKKKDKKKKKKKPVVEEKTTTFEDEYNEEPNDELDLNVLSQLMNDSDDEEKPKKKKKKKNKDMKKKTTTIIEITQEDEVPPELTIKEEPTQQVQQQPTVVSVNNDKYKKLFTYDTLNQICKKLDIHNCSNMDIMLNSLQQKLGNTFEMYMDREQELYILSLRAKLLYTFDKCKALGSLSIILSIFKEIIEKHNITEFPDKIEKLSNGKPKLTTNNLFTMINTKKTVMNTIPILEELLYLLPQN